MFLAVSSDLNLLGCFHHEDIHSSCPEKIVSYEMEEERRVGGREGGRLILRTCAIYIIHNYIQSMIFRTDPLYGFGSGGENIISQVPGKVSKILLQSGYMYFSKLEVVEYLFF